MGPFISGNILQKFWQSKITLFWPYKWALHLVWQNLTESSKKILLGVVKHTLVIGEKRGVAVLMIHLKPKEEILMHWRLLAPKKILPKLRKDAPDHPSWCGPRESRWPRWPLPPPPKRPTTSGGRPRPCRVKPSAGLSLRAAEKFGEFFSSGTVTRGSIHKILRIYKKSC